MQDLKRQDQIEIAGPNELQKEAERSLIEASMAQPYWLKALPAILLIFFIVGVVTIVVVMSFNSARTHLAMAEAIKAEAEATKELAETVNRQNAMLEGMSDRQEARMPSSKEIKDLMVLFGAIVLLLFAANMLFR